MTIVKVATLNPTKIEAIAEAFEIYFQDVEVMRYDVASGVPRQPVNEEVFQGAQNRLEGLKKEGEDNWDYLVSCEGGLINLYDYWFNVQVIMVQGKDEKIGIGLSQGCQIPPEYVEEVIDTSIAKVLDRIFEGKGGIRMLTHDQFTRKSLIKDGTIMALTRVLNGDVW